jgi:hypothetical protein
MFKVTQSLMNGSGTMLPMNFELGGAAFERETCSF